MKPDYKKIDNTIAKFNNDLVNRIEELATKVVKSNEGVTGFCMAMGSISFSVDFMETDSSYPDEDFHIDSNFDLDEMMEYKWIHEAALKEIIFIIDEYNWNFKLTGEPVRIRKINGEIIVDYDW